MECSVSRKWDRVGLCNHQPPNLPELHERCSTGEWGCKEEKRKRRKNREERMKERWKGRRWVGTLICSHMLFTMVSYYGLYFRCAFGYNGVNCEDSEYKSLASLLNTWKHWSHSEFNSVPQSLCLPSWRGRKSACSLSSLSCHPVPSLGHRQQHPCYRNSQNSAHEAGWRLGQVPSQPRVS